MDSVRIPLGGGADQKRDDRAAEHRIAKELQHLVGLVILALGARVMLVAKACAREGLHKKCLVLKGISKHPLDLGNMIKNRHTRSFRFRLSFYTFYHKFPPLSMRAREKGLTKEEKDVMIFVIIYNHLYYLEGSARDGSQDRLQKVYRHRQGCPDPTR
jgi:hypothetical protein